MSVTDFARVDIDLDGEKGRMNGAHHACMSGVVSNDIEAGSSSMRMSELGDRMHASLSYLYGGLNRGNGKNGLNYEMCRIMKRTTLIFRT